MSALSTAAALALLITLGAQAVEFQRSTVCRQEAWLRSVELLTEAKLSRPRPQSGTLLRKCATRIWRLGDRAIWQRFAKTHQVELNLPGPL